MCINPLKNPLSGLGLASKAIKKGGVMGALSPALAMAGVFKKKKPDQPPPVVSNTTGAI